MLIPDSEHCAAVSAAIEGAFRCARQGMFFSAGYWARIAVNAAYRIDSFAVQERAEQLCEAAKSVIITMECKRHG